MSTEKVPALHQRPDELAHLVAALEHRTVIGMALGMLMERLDLDPDGAWGYLKRCSSAQNRKVVVLATEMVETRRLPVPEQRASA